MDSATIMSAISRSSFDAFIAINCAAPRIPASGFLISWASISAMPMALRAAVLTGRRLVSGLATMVSITPFMPGNGPAWTVAIRS